MTLKFRVYRRRKKNIKLLLILHEANKVADWFIEQIGYKPYR